MLHAPSSWESFADALEPGQTVAVVGAPDVGKSTFCEWLVQSLGRRGSVGLVDCDMGQTTLGPPTTVGGRIFDAPPEECADLWPAALGFVGSTTPQGHLLQAVAAAKRVCDEVRSSRPAHLVVDTTGLVSGGLGRVLKLTKLQLIQADVVALVERDGELDGLAWTLASTSMQVKRIAASPAAKARSHEQRRTRRRATLKAYFDKGERRTFELGGVLLRGCSMGHGQTLEPRQLDEVRSAMGVGVSHAETHGSTATVVVPGRPGPESLARAKRCLGVSDICCWVRNLLRRGVVSLEDDRAACLGLGVVEEWDPARRSLCVLTPVAQRDRVHALSAGSIRLASDGSELGGDPRPVYG